MRWLAVITMLIALSGAGTASAGSLTFKAQETTDLWRDVSGGMATGESILAKLDLEADWSGDVAGVSGLSARFRVVATNADFFSGRHVGDLQTVSNIEGDGYLHGFEMWGQKTWAGHASLRAGFLDLNADFDSIATAGLFINSSHGIGPDLSKSGFGGPSIFPVTALGLRGQWTPDKRWTVNLGVYDGAPGSPNDPGAFASTDLSNRQGATIIAQVDRTSASGVRVGVGVWGYTARFPEISAPLASQRGQGGAYGLVEGPIPGVKGLRGWVRVGFADGAVNTISGYRGAGLVLTGAFIGRPYDHIGVAVARAEIGGPSRRALGLRPAETNIEATYRMLVVRGLVLQPDVQYVVDPGGRYADALAMGFRVILTFHPQGPPPAS